MGDLPNFRIGGTECAARGVEVRTPAGQNGRRRGGAVDLLCGSCQLGCSIINRAMAVVDVRKNSRHDYNPPLAATNSRTLSAFSSRLPCSISAPLPSAGTK